MPVVSRPTTIAATASALKPTGAHFDRGSGLGTSEPAAPMVDLRMSMYCIRPMAIPMAARPKPQWKPDLPHTQPVIAGPSRPPMLTDM